MGPFRVYGVFRVYGALLRVWRPSECMMHFRVYGALKARA